MAMFAIHHIPQAKQRSDVSVGSHGLRSLRAWAGEQEGKHQVSVAPLTQCDTVGPLSVPLWASVSLFCGTRRAVLTGLLPAAVGTH